jgi:hypothetical protein
LTPAPTATPGAYNCRRVTCNASSECSGGSAGLCTGDVGKACDSNADCTGVGTCSTALKLPGSSTCTPTCTSDTTRMCAAVCSGNPFVTCLSDSDCSGIGTCSVQDSYCLGTDTCSLSAKVCTCPCARVACATDADCGPAVLYARNNASVVKATYNGTCSGGFCSECGPPGCPSNAKFPELRATTNASGIVTQTQALAALVAAAGRRFIPLTHSIIYETCTAFGLGGILDEVKRARLWILGGEIPNAVDLWLAMKNADRMITSSRCTNNPSLLCTSNADCTASGATCAVYKSTLRPQSTALFFDEVHVNVLGANAMASPINAYLSKLSPVCSGDTTTGCGRCSAHSGTSCLNSADCPDAATGEKCTKTDSVCSGAGKGLCTQERACNSASSCTTHKLCTLDLATSCTVDGDCTTGKGVCRTEGLLSPGEG